MATEAGQQFVELPFSRSFDSLEYNDAVIFGNGILFDGYKCCNEKLLFFALFWALDAAWWSGSGHSHWATSWHGSLPESTEASLSTPVLPVINCTYHRFDKGLSPQNCSVCGTFLWSCCTSAIAIPNLFCSSIGRENASNLAFVGGNRQIGHFTD